MVLRTFTQFAKRVPMIRFRKGGDAATAAGGASTSTQQQSTVHSYAPAIEDWELPPRYQRKAISFEEMEYINRGGPA